MKNRFVAVCHCILNPYSKVRGYSQDMTVFEEIINLMIKNNVAIIQLPCPELTLMGLNRWGHVRNQFDNPFFRKNCRDIFTPYLHQIQEYNNNGYSCVGILGINGSPSCGVDMSCTGKWGGELSNSDELSKTLASITLTETNGIFIDEINKLLLENEINLSFIGVDEENPKKAVKLLQQIIEEDYNE